MQPRRLHHPAKPRQPALCGPASSRFAAPHAHEEPHATGTWGLLAADPAPWPNNEEFCRVPSHLPRRMRVHDRPNSASASLQSCHSAKVQLGVLASGLENADPHPELIARAIASGEAVTYAAPVPVIECMAPSALVFECVMLTNSCSFFFSAFHLVYRHAGALLGPSRTERLSARVLPCHTELPSSTTALGIPTSQSHAWLFSHCGAQSPVSPPNAVKSHGDARSAACFSAGPPGDSFSSQEMDLSARTRAKTVIAHFRKCSTASSPEFQPPQNAHDPTWPPSRVVRRFHHGHAFLPRARRYCLPVACLAAQPKGHQWIGLRGAQTRWPVPAVQADLRGLGRKFDRTVTAEQQLHLIARRISLSDWGRPMHPWKLPSLSHRTPPPAHPRTSTTSSLASEAQLTPSAQT